jgi:dihydroorotate dehydrogenase (subfamily 1) family protein
VELNVSCPNVKGGGLAFGTDADTLKNLVKEIKSATLKPIIVKLSPNVTDITVLARAAENGGADGVSLINTLVGMRIDLKKAKPVLSVVTGGYSGKGVFPVALRMVYQVAGCGEPSDYRNGGRIHGVRRYRNDVRGRDGGYGR